MVASGGGGGSGGGGVEGRGKSSLMRTRISSPYSTAPRHFVSRLMSSTVSMGGLPVVHTLDYPVQHRKGKYYTRAHGIQYTLSVLLDDLLLSPALQFVAKFCFGGAAIVCVLEFGLAGVSWRADAWGR